VPGPDEAAEATFPSDPELVRRLAHLVPFLDVFEAPDFSFGEWVSARKSPDGTIQLGWYDASPQASAFIKAAYQAECIVGFDWPHWAATPEAVALAADPRLIADAGPGDVVRLLIAVVRSDRFSEGALADAYERGVLTAILRRAAVLSRA
jgi:hypothetical protein